MIKWLCFVMEKFSTIFLISCLFANIFSLPNEMTNSSEHSYSNITCSVEGSFLNILTFKLKFTEVKEMKDYERSNDDKFAHIFVVR